MITTLTVAHASSIDLEGHLFKGLLGFCSYLRFLLLYLNLSTTLIRSAVTPIAVTSPPAPAPWMTRGLAP